MTDRQTDRQAGKSKLELTLSPDKQAAELQGRRKKGELLGLSCRTESAAGVEATEATPVLQFLNIFETNEGHST